MSHLIKNNYKIQIRFNDCDLMGHVNNSIYLSYIEEARIIFLNSILEESWDWKQKGIIIKKHDIEYISPLKLNDDVYIFTEFGNIGNKSFELIHTFYKNQEITTKIKSLIICYNYNSSKTELIYPELILKINQL
jgi:acyl-CoA thioester hydrolase